MKKLAFTIALIGAFCLQSLAQSDLDALRFSTLSPLGSTARSIGMGGAIGALGADPSVQLINPAGLAQYRSGTFSIGLDLSMFGNQSTYQSLNPMNIRYSKASIPNVNLVFSNVNMDRGVPRTEGWVNYSIGIGINRTADYKKFTNYNGTNLNNSMLDYVASYVQGLPASALDANDEQLDHGFYYFENMFWYGYLIDSITDGDYYPYYDASNPQQFQNAYINRNGGMNEFNFSFAANYSHKVFLGFGLNLHTVNYTETNQFSETDNPATTGNWSRFDFTRNLNTQGTGFSGRLGILVKPNENVRIGASLTTPTILNLSDDYYDELYIVYDGGGSEDMRTIDKSFEYTVITPVRYGLQAAYVFGKLGVISAELEQVDYGTMSIGSDNYAFESENQRIANKYQSATNIKIGGELALNTFRLRAGYAKMGNPFASAQNQKQQFLSAGFGIQEKTMAFDLSFTKDLSEEIYVPYAINEVSSGNVVSQINGTRIALTLSFKF